MPNTAASTVDPQTAAAIEDADTMRLKANAEVYGPAQAHGAAGTVYTTATALLKSLLTVAYGTDAERVYDTMLDSGEGHAYCAAHIAREDATAHDLLTTYECLTPFGAKRHVAVCNCGWESPDTAFVGTATTRHRDHATLAALAA